MNLEKIEQLIKLVKEAKLNKFLFASFSLLIILDYFLNNFPS